MLERSPFLGTGCMLSYFQQNGRTEVESQRRESLTNPYTTVTSSYLTYHNLTGLLSHHFPLPGGSSVGATKESSRYELRQAEPLTAILLRKGHHAEGGR